MVLLLLLLAADPRNVHARTHARTHTTNACMHAHTMHGRTDSRTHMPRMHERGREGEEGMCRTIQNLQSLRAQTLTAYVLRRMC